MAQVLISTMQQYRRYVNLGCKILVMLNGQEREVLAARFSQQSFEVQVEPGGEFLGIAYKQPLYTYYTKPQSTKEQSQQAPYAQLSLFSENTAESAAPSPVSEKPKLEPSKPEPRKEAPTLVERLMQTSPRCPTVYSRTMYSDRTFWHTPNTSEPGGYDVHGNYWCADCRDRLELMNIGERLGYPEVSYFPHNPEEYRAIMIRPGREMWRRRLAEIWNPDLVKDKVDRLVREHEAALAQQGAAGREE